MYYIDTHTHLFSEQFDKDRADVIARALEVGVKKFILPNIDSSSFGSVLELTKQYPNICYPTIGLHPTSVDDNFEKELNFIYDTILKHSFVAIGEIGIDCYWTTQNVQQQRYVFKEQLRLASKNNLPVIIHARESFNEIFKILDELVPTSQIRGVFHSFSGTKFDYEKIKLYKTFKVGIGGIVTFKNSSIADVVKYMDMNDIVLETDSPYLAPVPYRGKRNESSYIPLIAAKIADLKNISVELVGEISTFNSNQLFDI